MNGEKPSVDAFSAENIKVLRSKRVVLDGVSLAIRPGELVALLGANGAGKSTFMSVLADEIELDHTLNAADAVKLNHCSLSSMKAASQARSRAVLPQKPGLGFDFDVSEVVSMGAYPFSELAEQEVERLCVSVLEKAGLSGLASRRYPELSGGEQQRVHFARVLLQILASRESDPHGRYLLLDEPTSSLDPLHQHVLLKTVSDLARDQRIGVLCIVHDVNLAACWSDRIALLESGTLFACDTPEQVLTPANLKRVYGVDVHVMPHPLKPGTPLVVFGA